MSGPALRRPLPRLALVLAGLLLAGSACARAPAPEAARLLRSTLPIESDWATRYWGLPGIGADRAWLAQVTGKGVKVAVIDSGVYSGHPDLPRQSALPHSNLCPAEAAGVPEDRNGHGTQVAGVIAGRQGGTHAVGVAWDAIVVPYKILCQSGFHPARAREAVARAIRDGVSIVNASWASLPDDPDLGKLLGSAPGILFVFAAPQGTVDFPDYGELSNVIFVAPATRHDELVPGAAASDTAIHLAAPGVEIATADLPPALGISTFQHASAGAAFVSGCAALLREAAPRLDAAAVKRLILDHARANLPGLLGKVQDGRRLDCGAAVEQAVVARTSPRAATEHAPHSPPATSRRPSPPVSAAALAPGASR